jgi:hypothetical protein
MKKLNPLWGFLFGAIAVLSIGWTMNASEVWLKGVVKTGSGKVTLTDSTGNLSTTSATLSTGLSAVTGTFTGAVAVSGALGVTGAATLKNASLLLTSVSADATASTESAQGTVGASGLISTLGTHAATVGSAGDSFTLPDASIGAVNVVCNAAAANAMDVFPFTSDSINKETANTAISLAAGECMICVKFTAVKWGCVIGSAT